MHPRQAPAAQAGVAAAAEGRSWSPDKAPCILPGQKLTWPRHAAIRSEADYARIPIGSFPVTVIQPAAGHPMSPAR
jgi:hypothetical protein